MRTCEAPEISTHYRETAREPYVFAGIKISDTRLGITFHAMVHLIYLFIRNNDAFIVRKMALRAHKNSSTQIWAHSYTFNVNQQFKFLTF